MDVGTCPLAVVVVEEVVVAEVVVVVVVVVLVVANVEAAVELVVEVGVIFPFVDVGTCTCGIVFAASASVAGGFEAALKAAVLGMMILVSFGASLGPSFDGCVPFDCGIACLDRVGLDCKLTFGPCLKLDLSAVTSSP